tara:strand:- start:956 stop:1594 length:639 start_codon:yes stop_codon:yes gene_type:complete
MAIKFRANKAQALTYAEMDTNLGSYFYSSSLSGTNLHLHYTGSENVPINQASHIVPLTAGQVQGPNYSVQYNENGGVSGSSAFIYSGSKVGINTIAADLTYALEVSGSIRASAGLLSNSDERLKENIYAIDNPLAKLNQIQGVYFNWKGKEEREVGFIAQQVQKVLPEVVAEDKKSYLSVDYSKVVPLLVGAIQEQNNLIRDLQGRINKLER